MANPEYNRAEVVAAICKRLATGEPLAQICRDDGFPDPSSVWAWCEADKSLAQDIARARLDGFDQIAQDALLISEGLKPVHIEGDSPSQRDKLRIHTRMQLLAKWDPKRYGDNVQVRHANAEGDGDASVTVKSALLDGLQSAMAKGKKPKA
jgi:hypothetical protein